MSYFYLDTKEFDKVAQTIEKYSDRSVGERGWEKDKRVYPGNLAGIR